MQRIQAQDALLPDGWARDVCVTLELGRITEISNLRSENAVSVDVLLPSPVNLHSHAFQRAMAGLTERRGLDPCDSFWTWRELMYRFLDKLNPDHVEAIAAQVFMEMLEAGYSAVAEFHYLHHDIGGTPYASAAEMAERIVAAAQTSGIGLTLLPVLYMQGGCDGRPLEGGQKRFGCDLDRFVDLHADSIVAVKNGPSDFAIGIAPHSLRAVPPGALAQVRNICANGPIHMHISEQVAEVEELKTHTGARPIEWLLEYAKVDAEWCLIHCTHMTERETHALAKTQAVAGLCPITESNLGDGTFNGSEFHAQGGRFGVGSDSNVHVALWEELATLEYSQRLRHQCRAAIATPNTSTGRTLFDAATRAGAQAAGRGSGQIEIGQLADFIGVSKKNPFLCHRSGDALLDGLIFGGRGRDCVTDVWSAGRHMVRESRHVQRERIQRNFISVMHDIGQDL